MARQNRHSRQIKGYPSLALMLLWSLLLTACSGIGQAVPPVVELRVEQTVALQDSYDKVVMSPDGTLCCLTAQDARLDFYQNGRLINRVGGQSTGSIFSYPSDVTLGADGTFWVVDAYQQKLYHFDRQGRQNGTLNLDFAGEPLLIDVNSAGRCYLYDRRQRLIWSFTELAPASRENFGRFDLNHPRLLVAQNGGLWVVDDTRGLQYGPGNNLVGEYGPDWLADDQGRLWQYRNGVLSDKQGLVTYPVGQYKNVWTHAGYWYFWNDQSLLVLRGITGKPGPVPEGNK